MKETPLINIHKKLEANLIDFGGYKMPLYYKSALKEHQQVRQALGVFDVSHMGEFIVSGKNAFKFLQKLTTNNLDKLKTGSAQYTLLLNDRGGIIDDLILYQLDREKYMLVVNASNIEKDYNWLLKHKEEGIQISDISSEISLIALQGPMASAVLSKLSTENLDKIPYYSFIKGEVASIKNIIISATGYTGAGGFELYVPNKFAEHLWNSIIKEGKLYNIEPAGLAARDSLRIEKGYCLYGHEISEEINPLEAKLSWVLDFNKNFVGKEASLKIKKSKPKKTLVGITILDRLIPRQGDHIMDENQEPIGIVTSGTFSPILKTSIAMGYLNTDPAKERETIFLKSRNKLIRGILTKLPFL